MADPLIRDLTRALSALAGGAPLRDGATRLLGALGYRSRRTADAGSVAEFLERLDSAKPDRPLTDRQRALFEPWRAVEIVFQLTDAEIGGQPGLFDAIGGFERGRIESFLFLAVDLKEDAYTRTHLAEIVRAVNARYAMPVVVLFRHGPSLTLAAVHRRTHGRDTERDVLEKVTLVKDVRASAPHRAHVDVLADLALPAMIRSGVRDFDGLHAAWEKVLDIEALNRRFYRELFDWFSSATDACRFPDDGAGDGSTERHVIRLVTRLLFIWFLKEKKLVPDELFDESFARQALRKHAPDRTDYYRAVLQNLFFATLNTEIDKRAFSTKKNRTHRDFTKYRYRDKLADPDGFTGLLRSVPFVNGGLFDCLDDFASVSAGGRRIDAFTDNKDHGKDLDVPARLFLDPKEGLFPLFRRYKFTVEENTPLDREVALDPELLGRAFENLLAAYNPETRETARKATGSYYTPRAVVDYMVGEALATVLAKRAEPTDGDAGFLRERLGYLLNWEDACDDAAALFRPDETDSLIGAIAGLKVLDPAVGSGAFPMGVLQTLTLALRRLDPDNALWEKLQKERAAERARAAFDTRDEAERTGELAEISRIFETYRDSDFGRKLYLIQNGVYGVDVQPIACQIAKLRFFISLVIEQNAGDDPADNYGIRPLPNLETRFVAADTLIGLQAETASLLFDDAVAVKRKEVAAVRERYFLADNRPKKLECVTEEQRLRSELRNILENERKTWAAAQERDVERKAERIPNPDARARLLEIERRGLAKRQRQYDQALADARKVAEWDPYDQNAHAAWFDPEWIFGVADGFDVVIGNPPYIQLQKDGGRLATRYENAGYETFTRTGDIYQLFYERGCGLLIPGAGTLAYITSNSWLRAEYGKPLRHWLADRHSPLRLIEMGKDVFDAVVDTSVLLVGQSGGAARVPAVDLDGLDDGAFPPPEDRWGEARPAGTAPWSILSATEWRVLDKMNAAGVPLSDWNVRINYGIKTGYNEAFVIDSDARNALVSEDPRSDKILKRMLRGRDIRRWRARWAGKWLIDTHNGYGEEPDRVPPVDIDDYPAVKRHLDRHLPALQRRQDKGRTPYNLRNCAYHEDFAGEKLFWIELVDRGRFAYDDGDVFGEATTFLLTGECLKFLCAVLNAKLTHWFLQHTAPTSGMGVIRWKKVYVEWLPIPMIPPEEQSPFVRLVDEILAVKDADPDADVTAHENEIDRLVYALYGLTEDEIVAVEGSLAVGSADDGIARTVAGGAGPTG